MKVIIDTETNALKGYTKLHVVAVRNADTGELINVFRNLDENREQHLQLSRLLHGCSCIIGHNILGFDIGVLNHFGLPSNFESILDTLVLSRLVNYNQKGGHSLESWGEYFKEEKSKFNDFSQWSQELEDRCIKDTQINYKLWKLLERYVLSPRWQKAIKLEHEVAILCNTLGINGFTFDYNTSVEYHKEISSKVYTLGNTFREIFPKRSKLIKEINPSITKSGSIHSKDFRWLPNPRDLTPYSPDSPFSLFEFEEFNFRSPAQVVQRLNEAGWKPVNKTKGHIQAEKDRDQEKLAHYREFGWKIDEENLATLPDDAPEASRKLAEAILLNSRLGDLTEWIEEAKIEERKDIENTKELSLLQSDSNISRSYNTDICNAFGKIEEGAQQKIFYEGFTGGCLPTVQFNIGGKDISNDERTDGISSRASRDQKGSSRTASILEESAIASVEENGCRPLPDSSKRVYRIHGNFNGIGSWTHRMSHQKPNMANIPALVNRQGREQPWGKEFRSLWQAAAGYKLVGVDAEGIQLRVFAHYCADEKLIRAISEGKKEDKSDIHSLNLAVLHPICNSRDTAKTFIYALLLGASVSKVASILQCTKSQASDSIKKILEFYPGWKRLKEKKIKEDAQRGYFEGLDGRLVLCPDEHRVLAGYLQNGEAIVMKTANLLWQKDLKEVNVDYRQVNFVHDEWQTEVLDKDNLPELVAKIQVKSIEDTGRSLGLLCPLAGSYKIGNNWAETH